MNSYKTYFNFLPQEFRKENNEKLFRLFLPFILELQEVLNDIESTRNLDVATGYYLDLIGQNIGEQRRGLPDDEYREIIRTRRLSYLSGGELHTVADVAKLIFKDFYQSVNETWHLPSFDNRSATIAVNVNKKTDMKLIDVLHRVRAGGVALDVASLNTWGDVFNNNANWGEVYEKHKNWGEVYGYVEE